MLRAIGALAILALSAVTGCGHSASTPSVDHVRVEVVNVDFDRETNSPFVLLQDKEGQRALPIWIGATEARTILLELHGITPERPMTSDLLRSVLDQTDNHVERVEISELRESTYYASIYLNHGRRPIDSRPSDAIALALGTKAPIFVSRKLLNSDTALDIGSRGGPFKSERALGLTVQEISAEMAPYFETAPGSGLLISDARAEAARAGISRGDVLTRVGDKQVHSLEEFRRQMAALKKGAQVTVAVKRGNAGRELTMKLSENAAK